MGTCKSEANGGSDAAGSTLATRFRILQTSLSTYCAPPGEFPQIVLICPFCRNPVHRVDRTLVCPRHHAFDLAREGYVNFLRSNHPGDSRDMLACRRRFLARGYYAPIAHRLAERAALHLAGMPYPGDSRQRTVIDAGCGEGYYLGYLQTHLGASGQVDLEYLGVDSSRAACRMAAQRYKNICFVVSDLKDLIPVADAAVDLLLDIFAPRSITEFTRVLAPAGLVIVVIPRPHHLTELTSSFPIIGIEPHKADHVIRQFEPLLELADRESLEYAIELTPEDVADLIGMSPSSRHLPGPVAPVSHSIQLTVAVELLVFRASGREPTHAGDGADDTGMLA